MRRNGRQSSQDLVQILVGAKKNQHECLVHRLWRGTAVFGRSTGSAHTAAIGTRPSMLQHAWVDPTRTYFSRRTTIGSTLVARRAGITVAESATAARIYTTALNVTASIPLTANSRLAIKRVSTIAPIKPPTMPIAASSIPCRTINPTMLSGLSLRNLRTRLAMVREKTQAAEP